ncbi:MAG TPA: carbohydrate kinase family protein [bacterium]|nr:carbohydrate kinase family protein [bacterium]HPN33278.1 carbohydrate kinase family protein [bacterium]
MVAKRNGIALIGSCVVDELTPAIAPGQLSYVDAGRFVDAQELAGEELVYSTGGMALNVGLDLAKIGGGYPITVIGKIGTDHRAELVRRQLVENGISDSHLIVDMQNVTSCTEVVHIRMPDGSIERIFRHTLGAMGSFSEKDIDFNVLQGHKIVQFGYGLLMPQFDLADTDYGAVMGRSLAKAQAMGLWTALDFVTPTADNLWKFLRYRDALHFLDICCINDDQACTLTGRTDPAEACQSLVRTFQVGCAVVHCGSRGPNYAYSRETGLIVQPNFVVPEQEYMGNTGAGDAFSAAILHGLHQSWPLADCLRFAAAAAAISLADVSATGAMKQEREIVLYMNNRPTH